MQKHVWGDSLVNSLLILDGVTFADWMTEWCICSDRRCYHFELMRSDQDILSDRWKGNFGRHRADHYDCSAWYRSLRQLLSVWRSRRALSAGCRCPLASPPFLAFTFAPNVA